MSTATVIGGGPAGLMAAQVLAEAGVSVTVYERMPSPGRKFMLAGHGGLNITHSEPREPFVGRYGSSAAAIAPMIDRFSPDQLRAWCDSLGQPTFVGSSGRVFPEAFRATPLMRAWLAHLADLGVRIERRHAWRGWDTDGAALIADAEGKTRAVASDVTIFALGGASWPHLGADGTWVPLFEARGIEVAPLRPANVGLRVAWSEVFAERFAGAPLKNVSISVRGSSMPPQRGDAMITATGIEGGPIYARGAAIREALDAAAGAPAILDVDLRPDVSEADLAARLDRRRPKDSASAWLRRAVGLDPAGVGLLREAGAGALPHDPGTVARLIKAVPVAVTGTMPIDRAISTAGGIEWSEVNEHLMLRGIPGTFVAGEMLDWEAPTGGYLLQASFSVGVTAAHGALAWLASRT